MSQDNDAPPPTITLQGTHVVVTGGSRGISRAITLAAARAGAGVLLTYRANATGAAFTAREAEATGAKAFVAQVDISSQADLATLLGTIRKSLGRVDAWINNAGADVLTGHGASLPRDEKLELLLRVDLIGTMMASWAAADLMRDQPTGGVIINMSWDRVLQGMGGENPELFAAIKGGVLSYSRALARSLAPAIRVNILGPGWIETAFGQEAPVSFRDAVTRQIPLGRWGTPDDVASAAIYLASDAARYMTGQMIMINGGDVM